MFVCVLQSLEDFGDDDDEDIDDRGYEEDNEDDQDYLEDKDERKSVEKKESGKITKINISGAKIFLMKLKLTCIKITGCRTC